MNIYSYSKIRKDGRTYGFISHSRKYGRIHMVYTMDLVASLCALYLSYPKKYRRFEKIWF